MKMIHFSLDFTKFLGRSPEFFVIVSPSPLSGRNLFQKKNREKSKHLNSNFEIVKFRKCLKIEQINPHRTNQFPKFLYRNNYTF